MQRLKKSVTLILLIGLAGCGATKIQIARSTKRPVETVGFTRLVANDKVKVTRSRIVLTNGEKEVSQEEKFFRANQHKLNGSVEGYKEVAELELAQPAEYLLIHEEDLGQLIANTVELQKLKEQGAK